MRLPSHSFIIVISGTTKYFFHLYLLTLSDPVHVPVNRNTEPGIIVVDIYHQPNSNISYGRKYFQFLSAMVYLVWDKSLHFHVGVPCLIRPGGFCILESRWLWKSLCKFLWNVISAPRFDDPLRTLSRLEIERERELESKVTAKLLARRRMQKAKYDSTLKILLLWYIEDRPIVARLSSISIIYIKNKFILKFLLARINLGLILVLFVISAWTNFTWFKYPVRNAITLNASSDFDKICCRLKTVTQCTNAVS